VSQPSDHQAVQRNEPISGLNRQLRFWRWAAIITLLVAGVLAWLNFTLRRGNDLPPEAAPPPGTGQPTVESSPQLQPWGRLVTEPIVIERPGHLFVEVDDYFASWPWRFGGTTPASIRAVLESADLTPEQTDWLQAEQNWLRTPEGISIQPPDELVRSLKPGSRAAIYGFLAGIPGNPFMNAPFKMPLNMADRWFADSGVPTTTERLIRDLSYEKGALLCFSDLAMLREATVPEGRLAVLRALSRMPARRAFLKVEPGDDLTSLVEYWKPGGRIEQMLPLLESLQLSQEGGRIDLSYLLPRFCREKLYTFPDPETHRDADMVDCFWTALNFFRYPPDQRFIDVPLRQRYLEEHYEVINGEPALGDIMVFHDQLGTAIHACVYIAGEVVFTKNGATVFSPWVLMSYQEMLAHYSTDGAPKLRILRGRRPSS
jgi:hypothetical protein